jgi:hypothetical protein
MGNRRPTANVKQWASAVIQLRQQAAPVKLQHLPQGMVGKPLVIRASGSVSGQVTFTYANGAQILVPVNPNAEYTEEKIPDAAFPAPTNQVSVTLVADGAGVIRCLVGFA